MRGSRRASATCVPSGSAHCKNKIQSICNGKCAPITIQVIVRAREKPLAQEQWVSMKKQCEEQWKTMKNTGTRRSAPLPTQLINTIWSFNAEFDSTVFGNAQNKANMTEIRAMSLSALCFWPRRGPDEAQSSDRPGPVHTRETSR
jgi:hypothetical protein